MTGRAPSRPVSLPGNAAAAVRTVERELTMLVRRGEEALFPAVLLQAPDGSTWRVTVTDTGELVTSQVARG